MSIAPVVDDNLDIRELVSLVAQRAGCEVPLLMLSAAASPDEHAAGLQSRADLYLKKPFTPAALAEQITRWRAQPARAS